MLRQLETPNLLSPITVLPGIGPKRAGLLETQMGIKTLGQLLHLVPRRYLAPGRHLDINELPTADGELVRISGTVTRTWVRGFGRRAVVSVEVEDESGKCVLPWFNQPYLKNAFPPGRALTAEGTVSLKRGVQLQSPHLIDLNVIVPPLTPIYPQADGIPSHFLAKAIAATRELLGAVDDPLPVAILESAQVPELNQALQYLHAPETTEQTEAGRRRLAWAEILRLELRRQRARRERSGAEHGPEMEESAIPDQEVWDRIFARIPFVLTTEQQSVLAILREEMASTQPMARLLHGEVGSGKTVIAFALALSEAAAGRQTALLAPTEILARQHLATFCQWLEGSQVQVVGFFGDDRPAERRLAVRSIAAGTAHIAIGTHALFGDDIHFARLGLVVFDEQHRFGVRQKAKLLTKGTNPQVLTMTATPIPRTMAWAQYGALDPCELRSRPGTGGEITTEVSTMDKFHAWAEKVRPQLESGQRCFVVAPHIDGEDGLLEIAARLGSTEWQGLELAVVSGRMPGAEVAAAVERFRRGQIHALLGTTVVEVGLDIAAIPLMAVVNAQRFGLASLHQLRGRLARGPKASSGKCILFGSDDSHHRLELLAACRDGFAVAAADLAERGPGALKGLRQHGRSDFHLFDPLLDHDLVDCLKLSEVRTWLLQLD